MNEDLWVCFSQYMTASEERIDGPKHSLIIFLFKYMFPCQ